MAESDAHEPTMEEILASIRKIISEDAGDGQKDAAEPAGEPAPAAEPAPMAAEAAPAPEMAAPEPVAPEEHDVLELTDEIPPDAEPAAGIEAPEMPEAPAPDMSLSDGAEPAAAEMDAVTELDDTAGMTQDSDVSFADPAEDAGDADVAAAAEVLDAAEAAEEAAPTDDLAAGLTEEPAGTDGLPPDMGMDLAMPEPDDGLAPGPVEDHDLALDMPQEPAAEAEAPELAADVLPEEPAEPDMGMDLAAPEPEMAAETPVADPAAEEATEESEPESASAPSGEGEGLFSEEARETLGTVLSGLNDQISEQAGDKKPQPLSRGEQEIGAIILDAVREKVDPAITTWLTENRSALIAEVKPYIRMWLDENLPTLLAEAVRNEIARVVKTHEK